MEWSDSEDEGNRLEEENQLEGLKQEITNGKWNVKRNRQAENGSADEAKAKSLKGDFFARHGHTVLAIDEDGSIFHRLATIKDKEAKKLESLVDWIVEIAGSSLQKPDRDGRTALHVAIQQRNCVILRHILVAYEQRRQAQKRDLDEILRARDGAQKSTVVHLAIQHPTPYEAPNSKQAKVVGMLIDKASKGTLQLRDSQSLTALHLAVEGRRCTPQQVEVVRKLVARCVAALTEKHEGVRSVYQHHEKTYREWSDKREASRAALSRADYLGQETEKPGTDRALDTTTTAGKPCQGGKDEETTMGGLGGDGGMVGGPPGKRDVTSQCRNPTSDALMAVEGGLPRPLQRRPTNGGYATAPESREGARKATAPPNTPDEASKRAIATELKHAYLRSTKDWQHAPHFLYDDELREIDEASFKSGYRCARLEDALMSVRIPHLVIKRSVVVPPVGSEDDGPAKRPTAPLGRTDLEVIFKWLRDDAGVRKIIELAVDDSHSPPHTDSVIERSVQRFDVEVWDWRKTDLCLRAIAQAAPNVREISLYWSGNNTVLYGWSDAQGGLKELVKLQKITVFSLQGIEGTDQDKRNFDRFKTRVKAMRSDIEVTMPDSRTQPSLRHTREPAKNSNALQNQRWLKCVDDFRAFIRRAPDHTSKDWSALEPVGIAVIDDGIDPTEKALHGRVVNGQCFCEGEPSSFYAEIVSLKLDERPQADHRSQFSVESATEAVRWATKYGASIINMSWSIEKTGDGQEDRFKSLKDAVRDADDDKILMFCSNNDQGLTKDNSYPGRFSEVVKIGAATAMGSSFHYVSADNVRFLFPGRVVENKHAAAETAETGPENRSAEGSSLATAFATGLAGLILHMLRLSSLHCRRDQRGDQFESFVRDPRKIKDMLENLSAKSRFVEVWKEFEGAEDKVRTKGRLERDRMEVIEGICTRLMFAKSQ
ncbi:hypothetical protein MAPG_10646 [Magnaporthiopsis poae ATCC 64411]|uniref:Peptidase S8/S53 domain-containing protein n=1 Tax=Magnaporthiopsis poae (strain ATCC 64411 / 73-15) TaxID=644358 RepID=A0A0C4ED53_MAGP6|nr:hypothetical protein MAPG_10646 [Magnaporthiopsis poae ATCC 64411]